MRSSNIVQKKESSPAKILIEMVKDANLKEYIRLYAVNTLVKIPPQAYERSTPAMDLLRIVKDSKLDKNTREYTAEGLLLIVQNRDSLSTD